MVHDYFLRQKYLTFFLHGDLISYRGDTGEILTMALGKHIAF